MSTSFGYDISIQPPLPVLSVLVRAPGATAGMLVDATADTGADRTVVPAHIARALLHPVGTLRLQGFGGRPFELARYDAEVEIGGHVDVIEVAGWGDEAIIGRDLLNRWVATFDGPLFRLDLKR